MFESCMPPKERLSRNQSYLSDAFSQNLDSFCVQDRISTFYRPLGISVLSKSCWGSKKWSRMHSEPFGSVWERFLAYLLQISVQLRLTLIWVSHRILRDQKGMESAGVASGLIGCETYAIFPCVAQRFYFAYQFEKMKEKSMVKSGYKIGKSSSRSRKWLTDLWKDCKMWSSYAISCSLSLISMLEYVFVCVDRTFHVQRDRRRSIFVSLLQPDSQILSIRATAR